MRILSVIALCFPAQFIQAQEAGPWIQKGDSLLSAGQSRKAIASYTTAIELDRRSVSAYEGRARAYLDLEQLDRFVLDVDQVLRMDTASFQGHLLKATYAIRGEDLNTAEHHAARAIAFAPDDKGRGEALLISGMAKAVYKDPGPAILDLEAGLASGADQLEARAVLARLYDTAGRHAEALDLLEDLCEAEPKNIAHWSNRGYELYKLKRYDEALDILAQALRIDKDEPVTLNNQAQVLLAKGSYKEAMRAVEHSLRSAPAHAHALKTRALIHFQLGEKEKGCADLADARTIGGIADLIQLIESHCPPGSGH